MLQLAVYFIREYTAVDAISPSARRSRIACLDDEVWHQSVHLTAIIIPSSAQLKEIFARLWRVLAIELNLEDAEVRGYFNPHPNYNCLVWLVRCDRQISSVGSRQAKRLRRFSRSQLKVRLSSGYL